ncbi:transcriptional regulator, partial [Mesorhizobium sp. M2D.F.Ca.ET.145.01.1.1]
WAEPVLVDRQSGRQLDSDDFTMATGPMATDRMRQRYRFTSNGSGLPLVDNALVDQSREEARSK